MPPDPSHVPLTTAEAEGQGLNRRARERLTAAGHWSHPRKGLWLPGPPDVPRAAHAAALAAAREALSGPVFGSHETAAFLHGIVDDPPALVHVTRAHGSARSYRGLRVQRAQLPAEHLRAGLTCPARTVVDLARSRTGGAALAGADQALRLGLVGRDELHRVLADLAGRPGVARAREVVGLADPGSESVLESLSRWLMHRGGVLVPQRQVRLRDARGLVGRVDFLWDDHRVVGEADGLGKYDRPEVLRSEKLRQDRLERLGFRVVRWGWRDVVDPGAAERLVRRWHWALAGRG